MLHSLISLRKDSEQDKWSFFAPGSEKKWYSISEDSPQGEWDKIAEKMMLAFAESGHQVFRATSPLPRGQLKSKGGGKLSRHYCADPGTIETVFRTVAEMCEELEPRHDRKEGPFVRGTMEFFVRAKCDQDNIPLNDVLAQEEYISIAKNSRTN